ncbi:MAG: S8 family serine peptidase, partial [Halanaerobiales bacterium]
IKLNKATEHRRLQQEILPPETEIIKQIDTDTYQIRAGEELLPELKNLPQIKEIEPNYLVHVQNTPDDPDFDRQWNLEMLAYEDYYGQVAGTGNTTVAVLDTGIIPDHPDLAANLVPGYDFIYDNEDPTDPAGEFSHGTHVAGIIGAVTDNGEGIAGTAGNIQIMPVRVMDKEGAGDYGSLISGIRWAAENGADIINLSLAGSVDSSLLKEAVKDAHDQGVTIIAAAGNSGEKNLYYPAKYEEVISVGAVGPSGERSYYSNYSSRLDLAAPGGDAMDSSRSYPRNRILSTGGPEREYEWKQGTSMAAPHVSAAAALLIASGKKGPKKIRKTLTENATPAGSETGAGILNIAAALGLSDSDNDSGEENDHSNKEDSDYNLENVRVFTVNPEEYNPDKQENLEPDTGVTRPGSRGRFTTNLKSGTRVIVAWLDTDQNGKINSGDYLAEKEVKIRTGKTRDVKLVLEVI